MNINNAAELMAGRLNLPGGVVVTIGTTGDTSWGRSELSSTSTKLLASLSWANLLVREHVKTGRPEYLERAVLFAQDFVRDNPPGGGARPADTWSAMYAGQRTSFLACLSLSAPQEADIAAALVQHGVWLASPDNDPGDWNQGIEAALGLLAAGCRLDRLDFEDASADRFTRMVATSIDAQGALNEQAPGYGAFVYERWALVATKLAECDRPVPTEISERRPLLLDFLSWATEPNGRLVQIGDTFSEAPPAVPGTSSQWAATGGAAGSPAQGRSKVYDSGYVFGRSAWTPFRSAFHYSLRFGPGRAFHGHYDHQSLTLAGANGPVLVEAGHSGYDVEVDRLWQRAPEAHNVVVLPGVNFDGLATTRLTRSASGADWQWWEVSDTAYSGRARTRGVFVDQGLEFALVQDRVARPTSGPIQQLWHLPAGSSVAVSGRSMATATSGDGDMQTVILQVSMPGQTVPAGATTVVSGRQSPMQGWVSTASGQRVAAPTVFANRTGTEARFVTLVASTAPGERVSATATQVGKNVVVRVTIDGVTRSVGLSSGGGMWREG